MNVLKYGVLCNVTFKNDKTSVFVCVFVGKCVFVIVFVNDLCDEVLHRVPTGEEGQKVALGNGGIPQRTE